MLLIETAVRNRLNRDQVREIRVVLEYTMARYENRAAQKREKTHTDESISNWICPGVFLYLLIVFANVIAIV